MERLSEAHPVPERWSGEPGSAGTTARPSTEAEGLLTVDLAAIRANYRQLGALAGGAAVAGVVKADAYGLGVVPVAEALAAAGCRTFFVAHFGEALELRPVLPEAEIFVLNGLAAGSEAACAAARIRPVLNSIEQAASWSREAARQGARLPAAVQVDTGMSRLGLAPADVEALASDAGFLEHTDLVLVMSHLACADEPENPANAAQLGRFLELSALLPEARRSLANSAGTFLGPRFRFDLVRPGIALYGGNPFAARPNPMRAAAKLQGRVIQLRDVPAGTAVGYGHRFVTHRPTRLATVGVGYADGWPRRLGNRAALWHGDRRLPVVGRVSMDSMVVDAGIVDAAPSGGADLQPGDLLDLIGPRQTLDDVARAADTISYEILTSLGWRFERRYIDEPAGAPA